MKTKNSPRKKKVAAIQPDSIEIAPVVKPAQQYTGVVRLSNMRTGRIVRMGAKAAGMLSAKYPNEFKIL